MNNDDRLADIMGILSFKVCPELRSAIKKYPKFNSPHEGYSILLEEVDELWEEVKIKQGKRDPEKLEKEAIQVAAMAIRFILDCTGDSAQK